jgi:hypothetical protein
MTLHRGKACVHDDCARVYDTSHQSAQDKCINLVLPTPGLTRFDDAIEFVSRCLYGDFC